MRLYLAGIGCGFGSGLGRAYLDGMLLPRKDLRCGHTSPSAMDGGGSMRMYIAGTTFMAEQTLMGQGSGYDHDLVARVNMLESYYYVKPWQTAIIHELKSFLLDSGAFTFAYNPRNGGRSVDWDEYLDGYAAYIVENDVRLFFELDIDPVVGYPEVLRMRRRLEDLTGRRCIPVWHRERGWDDWLRTCDEYGYVAIGGLATRDAKIIEPHLPRLLAEAKGRGAEVHGLGYSRLGKLKSVGFDSCDSTAWLQGNKGGFLYLFDGSNMQKRDRPDGTRIVAREAARHNFLEWVKYAEYLEGRA